MFESMPEMTTAVKALIFVLFLIVAVFGVFWALRRYAGAGGNAAARGRQPRLGQVDYIDLPDGRRKLIIVRRDNVEHLVMIGGPNDVVIEQNIVRGGAGAQRGDKADPALGRILAAVETLPRPVPLGEPTPFPLQPQTENSARAPRPAEEQAQWQWPTQGEPARPEPKLDTRPAPRTNAVNKPSNELSARPAAPREQAARPSTPPPVSRPAPAPPAPVATPAAAAMTPAPVMPPPSTPTPPSAPIVKVGIDEKIMANARPDQNLTDMAHMLEASLRRQSEPRFTEGPMAGKPAPMMVPPPAPAKVEAKPAAPKTYDSLEEEMASLLGRPPGKP